jgi:hypothetical protein
MPARERSSANLSMELTCPCAGRGKIRTCGGAFGPSSMLRSKSSAFSLESSSLNILPSYIKSHFIFIIF